MTSRRTRLPSHLLSKFRECARLASERLAEYRDELYAVEAVKLALGALRNDNYGVGCVIVDNAGRIVERGGNAVFHPRFRSEAHAEMVTMSRFEKRHSTLSVTMNHYTLYASLEPCPMCLARLIGSGIGAIKYVADDALGGMVSRKEALPPAWVRLMNCQRIEKAQSSPAVQELASEAFLHNLASLRSRLFERRGEGPV